MTLLRTAENAPPASVRVIWTSSIAVDLSAPNSGLDIAELTTPSSNQQRGYLNTKTGNWFLANALAAQIGKKGILSLTQNPGNLKTPLLRHAPWILGFVARPLLYPAKLGAYTELWSGLAEDLGVNDGGKYVVPWGRLHPSPREDFDGSDEDKGRRWNRYSGKVCGVLRGKDEGVLSDGRITIMRIHLDPALSRSISCFYRDVFSGSDPNHGRGSEPW